MATKPSNNIANEYPVAGHNEQTNHSTEAVSGRC